jgi:NADH:ubiquinone oxidoreductase subunit F (NADH-binding)/NADH:ubiquinone oxidoreductase subunit E
MIVQRLRTIQNLFGYLPDAELKQLAAEIDVPLYKLEEIASFFPAFRQERNKPPYVEVKVCRDMSCHHRGAANALSADGPIRNLASELRAAGRAVHVEGVSCLGRCDRAPVIWVERHEHEERDDGVIVTKPPQFPGEHGWVYAGRNAPDAANVIRTIAYAAPRPQPDTDERYRINTNADVKFDATGAPLWKINVYGREPDRPKYDAVRRFIQTILMEKGGKFPEPPADLGGKALSEHVKQHHPSLWQMSEAGLLGMGGAGTPTYQKWLDVWGQPGPTKYIVCNGDESEPGTFKDRELLLRMPHLVVEGVILAGLATNATAGYIYIRHEYPEQIAACRKAIAEAEELGACGPNVFDSGRSFPVEVFESPGGYICGEQSALLEAMEDKRSQPRNRPPELTTNGLFDKPTVVNNVETLAWAPYILLRGGAAYAKHGMKSNDGTGFSGRRLFSISGDINRPGVFEVPIGLTLGDLINKPDLAGGITQGRKLGFVATSGPSGGILPAKLPIDQSFRKNLERNLGRMRERSAADADSMKAFVERHLPPGTKHLDVHALPLDLVFFRNLHTVLRLPVEPMLGAGITVYAEGTDPLDTAVNFSQFFRNESCGKCVPCRIGSTKITQIGLGLIERRRVGDVIAPEVEIINENIQELTRAMQQTSICGLGYVAPIPLSCALTYFPDDVVAQKAK